MATSKTFMDFISEQWKGIPDISYRPMMGEYLFYYRGKLIGDICDNCVYIKPIPVAESILPDAPKRPPYDGAKDMILLEDLDNIDLIHKLFDAMYIQLPEPKAKKIKK